MVLLFGLMREVPMAQAIQGVEAEPRRPASRR